MYFNFYRRLSYLTRPIALVNKLISTYKRSLIYFACYFLLMNANEEVQQNRVRVCVCANKQNFCPAYSLE